jgi:hypothetical protein
MGSRLGEFSAITPFQGSVSSTSSRRRRRARFERIRRRDRDWVGEHYSATTVAGVTVYDLSGGP